MNNPETAKCASCGNANEVKVSTGHNNPENKGRKYFTCLGCKQFNWVENGEGQHPSGLKIDYSKTPERKAPGQKEEVDWDEVARGKIRSLLIEAHIQNNGLDYPSQIEVEMVNQWVEIAMTGKLSPKNQKEQLRNGQSQEEDGYFASLAGES